MEVDVNWLAVVLAGASSMIVGSIWYAQGVFGAMWIKLAKIDVKKKDANIAIPISIAFVMSLLTAYVIAHVAALSKEFFDVSTLEAGLSTAFWLWLGISVTTTVTHDAFEGRPTKLSLLTIGNRFVTLMLMGLIIGALGKF